MFLKRSDTSATFIFFNTHLFSPSFLLCYFCKMKKTVSVFILISLSCLFCLSCHRNGSNPGNANDVTTTKDTTHFFQVNQYLQGQIKQVSSTPFFIYKLDIINGKKDSSAITTAIFNQISQQFLKPDINDEKLKPNYKESIFEDQTTKSFTISYSTTNKELEVQNIEILLDEDGQTVKRLFIRKFFNYTDSSAIEQLSWKPGERFQVNRSVQKPDNSEASYQTTVVWNQNG